MIDDVGKKIKELRTKNNLTLKDLSAKSGMSIGFLSQLERGLTTIAIDTLSNLGEALGVDLYYFLSSPKQNKKPILRSYEKEVFQINSNQFIYYNLTNHTEDKVLLPRYIEILPTNSNEDVTAYNHEGEEFIYIIEGILTLVIEDEQFELFPGDSAHYSSTTFHNWANCTSKTVKLIAVHTPNLFKNS
ncbi:helix-turn-helix domain-containing protein [Clostridium algidicarnis]|uniref:helix-turn-helix domain-containing protein n=1 Tax=Clostridium algidicarnis TaxID=37659 RepID=UPI001C0CD346|nr:XRE family transcriptional regulator [Clostridium algidicarnis]MBU3192796.1 XRE family transcriptional regulator [Clostridium algidicarnis]